MGLKIVFSGKLSGVDFVKEGEMIGKDGELIKFDSKVKLKFSYEKEIEKQGIKTIGADTLTVKFPVDTAKLEIMVHKYNSLIGKELSFDLVNYGAFVFNGELDSIKEINPKPTNNR